MAIPPWQPVIPPEFQALMNQGNYREALKKGTIEIGKQIVKQGPRVVMPIAETTAAGLRTMGMFAEAPALLAAATDLGMKATLLETLGALSAGWEGIVAGGAAASGAAPLICIVGLGFLALMAMKSRPANAAALKKEYQNLNQELYKAAPHKHRSLWDQLPKPGNA